MAIIVVPVEKITLVGIDPTDTGSLSITNNYFVRNTGKVFLHFKKTGVGDCVVTIVTRITVLGLAVADVAVTIPATTGDIMIGPFPPAVFNDNNGDLEFTLDDILSLTVAALEL